MPERDLALLIDAARAAGEIALRYWQNAPETWDKHDASPVTEADLAVNDMLQARLLQARPTYGWLSEESVDTDARLDSEHVFIIDPIDGTRAFIAGETHFSHSLAVARKGKVTAAAIYLPALDCMYTATENGPAEMNGQPIHTAHRILADGVNLLTPKVNLEPDFWNGDPPQVKRSFRASIAYRMCLVADGSFDGILSFRDAWEWDIAAGALIAARAGAMVSDGRGQAIEFNSPKARAAGIFAASPPLHAELSARFKA